MNLPISPRHVPARLATGAWILHSGVEKWGGDETSAKGYHAFATTAFPFLKKVPPQRFLRVLAAGEIAVGAVMLAPFVSPALAGAALTGFSASLLALYFRTPGMRKPGSVWPTPDGVAVSKDVWMLGIGLGLLADAVVEARRHR